MVKLATSPTANALRQRRHKALRRKGIREYRVKASILEISELLVEQGFLASEKCENPREVEIALEHYLRAICAYE